MPCPHCASPTTTRQPKTTVLGYQIFRCSACRRRFNERTGTCRGGKIGPCSACALVDVMQAAQNGPPVDGASRRTHGGLGRVEQQAPMRTFGVVVPNQLGEYRPQVRLIDDD